MGAGAVSPGAVKKEPEDEHGNNNREWKDMLPYSNLDDGSNFETIKVAREEIESANIVIP